MGYGISTFWLPCLSVGEYSKEYNLSLIYYIKLWSFEDKILVLFDSMLFLPSPVLA